MTLHLVINRASIMIVYELYMESSMSYYVLLCGRCDGKHQHDVEVVELAEGDVWPPSSIDPVRFSLVARLRACFSS